MGGREAVLPRVDVELGKKSQCGFTAVYIKKYKIKGEF